jgi:hypothetical protein
MGVSWASARSTGRWRTGAPPAGPRRFWAPAAAWAAAAGSGCWRASSGLRPVVGDGDEVETFVLRSESHGGTASVRICLTPVRVVGSNMRAPAHGGEAGSRPVGVQHRRWLGSHPAALREVIARAERAYAGTPAQYGIGIHRQVGWVLGRVVLGKKLASPL